MQLSLRNALSWHILCDNDEEGAFQRNVSFENTYAHVDHDQFFPVCTAGEYHPGKTNVMPPGYSVLDIPGLSGHDRKSRTLIAHRVINNVGLTLQAL